MIRVSLLCLTCFGVFVACDEAVAPTKSVIPVCKDKSAQDIFLDLSHMGLQKISKSFASSASITCINLEGNEVVTIDHEAFDGLPQLKYLNFANNSLSSFSDLSKTALSNLRTLILDGPSKNERESDFKYWELLHHYRIMRQEYEFMRDRGCSFNNYLENYETLRSNEGSSLSYSNVSYKFEHFVLPELEELSLRYHEPTYLFNMLRSFEVPNLKRLHISNNALHDIDYFPNAIYLTHLYLDDNYLRILMESSLKSLEYLSMDRNQIQKVCSQYCNTDSISIHSMYNLTYLSLVQNNISEIDSDAFENCVNLRNLRLSDNNIDHFMKHTFDNLSRLEELALDNNKLTSVPDICALKQLNSLSLSGNEIATINANSFCNLPNLTVINLSNNRLTNIPDGSFGQITHLKTLDLSRNALTSLSETWINLHNSLSSLKLDSNRFNDIESMSLHFLKVLRNLSFRNNPFKNITIESLLNLPPQTQIDLSRARRSILLKGFISEQ